MSYTGAKDQADRAVTKATAASESSENEAQKLLAEAVAHLGMAISAMAVELHEHNT